MNRLNKLLGYLPIFIYSYSVILPFIILFFVDWFIANDDSLELIDFILCIICLFHFCFYYKSYCHLAKSSFSVMIVLTIYHVIYYNFDIDNKVYYTIYAMILAINPLYFIMREVIKK